jgi:hypothetical protein
MISQISPRLKVLFILNEITEHYFVLTIYFASHIYGIRLERNRRALRYIYDAKRNFYEKMERRSIERQMLRLYKQSADETELSMIA